VEKNEPREREREDNSSSELESQKPKWVTKGQTNKSCFKAPSGGCIKVEPKYGKYEEIG
jgi:hypothetical protein